MVVDLEDLDALRWHRDGIGHGIEVVDRGLFPFRTPPFGMPETEHSLPFRACFALPCGCVISTGFSPFNKSP